MAQWLSPPATLIEGKSSISSTSYFLNLREKKIPATTKDYVTSRGKQKQTKAIIKQ